MIKPCRFLTVHRSMIPPSIEVRLLSPDESRVLDSVAPDVFDHAVEPRFVDAFFRDPRSMIAVAIDDGVVVGMATAFTYVHPDKPRQLFINEVGVAPPYQRRGLGSALVAALLERAKQMGCVEAWVATEEENTPARLLYQSLGGKEDAARAVVYTFPLSDGKPHAPDE